jgi:hypothetical protein
MGQLAWHNQNTEVNGLKTASTCASFIEIDIVFESFFLLILDRYG